MFNYTPSLLAISMLYRKDFYGKNDKYAPMANRDSAFKLALQGKDIFNVSGTVTEQMRDQSLSRLNRYMNNQAFFDGRHFTNPYNADGEEKLVFNYCEHITNLTADWLVADGISFTCPEGNEVIANLLNRVWEFNNGSAMLWKAAQFGGINGDVFFYVTVASKDVSGNDLPKDQWTVRINALNPSWVHPVWSPTQPDEMISCLIQFPHMDSDGHLSLFTMLIAPDKVTTWQNSNKTGEQVNPMGCINVVHVPHQIVSNGIFGTGEVDRIWRINQKLNTIGGTIERIIKYHAEPTTIIFGATMSQLEKGSNRLWSGLPETAKVENLQLQSDLAATYKWFEQLKKELAVKAEVPMFLLDSETFNHVSNTSGAAMQLLFQPILSKTDRCRMTYGKGLRSIAKLVLIAHEKIIGDDLRILADNPDALYSAEPVFSSPLPRDEQNELDMVIKKLNGGILSLAEAIRQVSNVKNVQRLIIELAADQRAKIAVSREMLVASKGGTPAYTCVFMSSPFLSEDLAEVATATSSAGSETSDETAGSSGQ